MADRLPVPQDHDTIPVILASRRMKALWPWSVPGCPYPLQSAGTSEAPVTTLIRALDASPGFLPPILVIAPDMLQSALGALSGSDCPMPSIMTVPAGTQGGVAATLIALETASEAREAPLTFLPAAFRTLDPLNDFLDHVTGAMVPAAASGFAVVAARRGIDLSGGTALIAGSSEAGTGFRQTTRCLSLETGGEPGEPGDGDIIEAASDQGALWSASGPVVVRADRVLEMVRDVDPMLVQACENALHRAERRGNIVHPEQNFLSLVRDQSVGRILAGNVRSILIDPVGETVTPIRSWADVPPDAPARLQKPARAVHSAGMPECTFISGPGGLLALAAGHEGHVACHFGTASSVSDVPAGTQQAIRPRQRPWGSEEVVDMRLGLAILRLTVTPGAALEPECHVHRSESWVIAGGRGRALIGGEPRELIAGDHVVIPRGIVHALENTGGEPLVVYETRTGALTGEEDDRIAAAPSRKVG